MDLAGRWTWLNTGSHPVGPMRDETPELPSEPSIQAKLRRYRRVVELRSEKQLEQSAYRVEGSRVAFLKELRKKERVQAITRLPTDAELEEELYRSPSDPELEGELCRSPSTPLPSRPGTAEACRKRQPSRPVPDSQRAAFRQRPSSGPSCSDNERLRPRPPSGKSTSKRRPASSGRIPSAGRRGDRIAPGMPGSCRPVTPHGRGRPPLGVQNATSDLTMAKLAMHDTDQVLLMSQCPEAADVPAPSGLCHFNIDVDLAAGASSSKSAAGNMPVDLIDDIRISVLKWVAAAYARFAVRSSDRSSILRECSKWLALTCNTRKGALHSLADLEAACLDIGIEQSSVTAVAAHLWTHLADDAGLPVVELSRLIEEEPWLAQEECFDTDVGDQQSLPKIAGMMQQFVRPPEKTTLQKIADAPAEHQKALVAECPPTTNKAIHEESIASIKPTVKVRMDIHGNPWISMDIHGHPELSVDSRTSVDSRALTHFVVNEAVVKAAQAESRSRALTNFVVKAAVVKAALAESRPCTQLLVEAAEKTQAKEPTSDTVVFEETKALTECLVKAQVPIVNSRMAVVEAAVVESKASTQLFLEASITKTRKLASDEVVLEESEALTKSSVKARDPIVKFVVKSAVRNASLVESKVLPQLVVEAAVTQTRTSTSDMERLTKTKTLTEFVVKEAIKKAALIAAAVVVEADAEEDLLHSSAVWWGRNTPGDDIWICSSAPAKPDVLASTVAIYVASMLVSNAVEQAQRQTPEICDETNRLDLAATDVGNRMSQTIAQHDTNEKVAALGYDETTCWYDDTVESTIELALAEAEKPREQASQSKVCSSPSRVIGARASDESEDKPTLETNLSMIDIAPARYDFDENRFLENLNAEAEDEQDVAQTRVELCNNSKKDGAMKQLVNKVTSAMAFSSVGRRLFRRRGSKVPPVGGSQAWSSVHSVE